MFRIEIATDNAAFDDDPASEVGRILRKLAENFLHFGDWRAAESGDVRDYNGNTVGRWQYTPED